MGSKNFKSCYKKIPCDINDFNLDFSNEKKLEELKNYLKSNNNTVEERLNIIRSHSISSNYCIIDEKFISTITDYLSYIIDFKIIKQNRSKNLLFKNTYKNREFLKHISSAENLTDYEIYINDFLNNYSNSIVESELFHNNYTYGKVNSTQINLFDEIFDCSQIIDFDMTNFRNFKNESSAISKKLKNFSNNKMCSICPKNKYLHLSHILVF